MVHIAKMIRKRRVSVARKHAARPAGEISSIHRKKNEWSRRNVAPATIRCPKDPKRHAVTAR